jgi:hypothetical protein
MQGWVPAEDFCRHVSEAQLVNSEMEVFTVANIL